MGKQFTGRRRAKNNRYKLPLEYADNPNHGLIELTTMSQKPLKTPETITREALASLYCGRAVGAIWPVFRTSDDKQVATLSLRRERLCYKLMPGVPEADGKMHIVNSKHRKDGLLAIARKIGCYMVEVAS